MARPPLRLRPEIEAHPLWPEIQRAYREGRDLDVAALAGDTRPEPNVFQFGELAVQFIVNPYFGSVDMKMVENYSDV